MIIPAGSAMTYYPPQQQPAPVPYAQAFGHTFDPYAYQAVKDADHLRLLAIFHYIWGPLQMLFSSFCLVYVFLGFMVLNDPSAMDRTNPPPREMGYMFVAMGGVGTAIGWAVGILTIVSGRCIARRRWRVFSLVMAGINSLSVPIGTALGVFTFVILLRDSVRRLYLGPGELDAARSASGYAPRPGGAAQGYHPPVGGGGPLQG